MDAYFVGGMICIFIRINQMKLTNALLVAACVVVWSTGESPIANARQSRCCYYNDKRIDCNFMTTDDSLTIEWSDGLKESYSLVSQQDFSSKTYQDSRGGIWEWNLHPQGNISLTNPANGNRISKPLRGCS